MATHIVPVAPKLRIGSREYTSLTADVSQSRSYSALGSDIQHVRTLRMRLEQRKPAEYDQIEAANL